MPSGDQATQVSKHRARRTQPQNKSLLRNNFAPLRSEIEESKGDQQKPTSLADMPPPTILTSATNLLVLQKKTQEALSRETLSSTTPGTEPDVTMEMAEFSAIKSFQNEKLSFFTFHLKSKRLSKDTFLKIFELRKLGGTNGAWLQSYQRQADILKLKDTSRRKS